MRKRNKTSEEGMTLIEVLMAAAIGAVLLAALTVSSGIFLDSYTESLDEQDLTLAHHIALDRILRAISMASEVDVQSSASLFLTFPDASTELYHWSGASGDSLFLAQDGGDDIALVDGVANLNFLANMVDIVEEEIEVQTETLLTFTDFPGIDDEWEHYRLENGGLSKWGLTFMVYYEAEVEQIDLTEIRLMLGKADWQPGDTKITLWEGLCESRPRIWGDVIGTHIIPNYKLPLVTWDEGEIVWIPWMTVNLSEGFVIQPNRYYCLLLEQATSYESGFLRTAYTGGSTGPENGMAWFGTTDGGVTWDPPLGTAEYTHRDVPIQLTGDVSLIVRTPTQRVDSVDVTMGLALGDRVEVGSGSAKVRGGGEEE